MKYLLAYSCTQESVGAVEQLKLMLKEEDSVQIITIMDESASERQVERAEKVLQAAEEALLEHSACAVAWSIENCKRDKRKSATLIDTINHGDFDIVVMGSKRHSALRRMIMGTTNTKVLKEVKECSILVAPPSQLRQQQKFLLCVQDDEYGWESAKQLGKMLHADSTVVVVSFYTAESKPKGIGGATSAVTKESPDALIRKDAADLVQRVGCALQKATHDTLQRNILIGKVVFCRDGRIKNALEEYVRQHGDLTCVVVGAGSKGGDMGSTTNYVLNNIRIPVLVVKAPMSQSQNRNQPAPASSPGLSPHLSREASPTLRRLDLDPGPASGSSGAGGKATGQMAIMEVTPPTPTPGISPPTGSNSKFPITPDMTRLS